MVTVAVPGVDIDTEDAAGEALPLPGAGASARFDVVGSSGR
jgi:hypothetical protein